LWRAAPYKGELLFFAINLGKSPAALQVRTPDNKKFTAHDLIQNQSSCTDFTLAPYEIKLLRLTMTTGETKPKEKSPSSFKRFFRWLF
jgi:hypothetical protein